MILRRKNFLPLLMLSFLLIVTLVAIVYFADPSSSLFVLLFFVNIFLLLFLIASLVLVNSRIGFIVSTCLTVYVVLRYFGIGNILNAALLIGLGIIGLLYERTTKTNR